MRILITNLDTEPLSVDFTSSDGDEIRELIPVGRFVDVGDRIHPYDLNRNESIRRLVQQSRITVQILAAVAPDPPDLVPTPGGGSGHVIQNGGAALPAQPNLNFFNGLQAADNAGSSRTDVSPVYGTGANQVTQGNDARIPTQAENDALQGTNGAPAGGNRYVTDSDPRNTNARTPTVHQASHQSGGGDALTGNLDATARVMTRRNSGADVGPRRRLNFIEGSNVTLTVADDGAAEEVDITIAAAGGSVTGQENNLVLGAEFFGR